MEMSDGINHLVAQETKKRMVWRKIIEANVIITGLTTYDSITNGGLTGSSGSSDAFIAKFDSTGGFKWMKTYGSTSDDAGWDVKVDRNKYIITGWTKAVSAGDNDIFVLTCDTSGNNINAQALGTTGDG